MQTNGHCAHSEESACASAQQPGTPVAWDLWILARSCLLSLTEEAGTCQANRISDSGREDDAFDTMQRWDGHKYRDLWSLQPDCLMEEGGVVRSCLYKEWCLLNWEWIFLVEVFSTSGGKIWKQERLSLRFICVALPMAVFFKEWVVFWGEKEGQGRQLGKGCKN